MTDLDFVTGFIGKHGAKLSGTGDYTVSVGGTGMYSVVFHPPFAATPVVVVTQVYPNDLQSSGGKTTDNAIIVGVTERQFKVKTGGQHGDVSDRDWTFIAAGIGLSGAALAEWEAEEKARPEAEDQ